VALSEIAQVPRFSRAGARIDIHQKLDGRIPVCCGDTTSKERATSSCIMRRCSASLAASNAGCCITYVLPSSLIVVEENPQLLVAAQALDAKVEALVESAVASYSATLLSGLRDVEQSYSSDSKKLDPLNLAEWREPEASRRAFLSFGPR